MSPLDAFWHLLAFLGPAIGVGAFASLLAKLVYRRAFKRVGWLRLGCIAASCAAIALCAGLAVFGRDGRMATYGAMVVACALSLWWIGFRPLRPRGRATSGRAPR